MTLPIRVLYVNGGLMNRGGIESYMMNYYRHFDKNKIQIDFIVHKTYAFFLRRVASLFASFSALSKFSCL